MVDTAGDVGSVAEVRGKRSLLGVSGGGLNVVHDVVQMVVGRRHVQLERTYRM